MVKVQINVPCQSLTLCKANVKFSVETWLFVLPHLPHRVRQRSKETVGKKVQSTCVGGGHARDS